MKESIKASDLERDWQLENDVRIIEEYQKIVSDKNRLERCLKAIEKKVDNLNERASALEKTRLSFNKKK